MIQTYILNIYIPGYPQMVRLAGGADSNDHWIQSSPKNQNEIRRNLLTPFVLESTRFSAWLCLATFQVHAPSVGDRISLETCSLIPLPGMARVFRILSWLIVRVPTNDNSVPVSRVFYGDESGSD